MRFRILMVAAMVGVVLVLSSLLLTRPAFDGHLDGTGTGTIAVLPLERGLTFARIGAGEGRPARLVIVRSASGSSLTVADVGAFISRPTDDPLVALTMSGYEELDYAARNAPAEQVQLDDLQVPLVTGDAHIAAGTNYRAHAEEVGIEDGPFLFPKLAQPTAWNAAVKQRGRLDYEAELCVVPLTTILPDRPARYGYVLCNDFTDRWPLVTDTDFDLPMGTTGFPEAKGGDGMLPLGPFFFVPRDDPQMWSAFELDLYVNGVQRQHSSTGLMIWNPDTITTRAFAQCELDFLAPAGVTRIASCASIPAGTLLLTGTPEGVLFHPATVWNPFAYLRAGDVVVVQAAGLGVLRTTVE